MSASPASSANRPSPEPAPSEAGGADSLLPQIEASCRIPVLFFFACGAAWLLFESRVWTPSPRLSFTSRNFWLTCPWLTYGRVRPAFLNTVPLRFCVASRIWSRDLADLQAWPRAVDISRGRDVCRSLLECWGEIGRLRHSAR